uniref:palmitoyl-protein hydrolase n=1 Tax=Pristionchus pacificus TaxID=54126 RepID=A0A2A6BKQ0_PRIPA|eukprot:PDM66467.1 aho-3 [Pristionchus pacificus]
MSSTGHNSESSNDRGGAGGNGGPQRAPGRVSMRDLCCLFCCPPFPSSIVSKLAFMPPESSYTITDDGRLSLVDGRTEWQNDESSLERVQMLTTRTRRGNKIACMMVRPPIEAHFTILFSHGNAVDIGQMSSFYGGLGQRLGVNVFSYDYSGYGCSTGKPSEKNLYADIQAALDVLQKELDIPASRVILYGQSIGTVPSVDLASKNPNVAALVLHSPLMSGMRVAFPGTSRSWCCDAFPSIDKVPKVKVPTLVIHGTEDEVIDFSHGVSIHESCPASVEPLWVSGAGHNDVELHSAYLDRLQRFINHETNGGAATTVAS